MTVEPTVYVVDDDSGARESVCALAESMGLRAFGFVSAEDFLGSRTGAETGCLVTDLRMMKMSGLELQQKLLEDGVELPVILMSGFADVPVAVQAMQTGAVTVLQKPCRQQELWDGIRKALDLDEANRQKRTRQQQLQERLGRLTSEERAVMDRMVEGKLNKVIARELDIGLRTVEQRRHNVLRKMEAASLAELVRLVMAALPEEE